MKRTCGNVFSWLKPPPKIQVVKNPITIVEEEPEDMEIEDREKEERLDRVKKKEIEYKKTSIC